MKPEFRPGVEWRGVRVPGNFDAQFAGLAGCVGLFWYRLEFELPKEFAGVECELQLGPIDDESRTWLNGRPDRCADRLGRSVPLLPLVSIAAFAATRSPCRAAVFRCAALCGRKIEIFLYSVVRSMKKTENDVILLLNPNPFREDEAHEIRNLLRLLGTGVDRRLFQVY
ncbi:hypothetical protein [uncultured Victivallis sp.]|uniref:hypothetical protein n=1 Tax=uncultured Victivallis sp. TaxID=354118 RepID=UPI0025986CF8|nr:hypothetical protein [uncultured Victivallis sp.]